MNREELASLTRCSLRTCMNNIVINYMAIYNRYYSEEQTREDAFLKDLVDSLKGIEAVLEVYVNHGFNINPGYALEKLKNAKSYIDCNISFFEKLEKEGE